jgi:WD40 repeat protein/serine/threonine protein kinase
MPETNPTRERLFHAAAELKEPAQRAAFLDAACGANPQLRAEIEELLRHDAEAGSFLEKPSEPTGPYRPIPEGAGSLIGPYKLLQQIGEGGFGVVYMAEQQQPVRRKVALKIIKPGMDTKEVIARFESERQALALMDHPNVARVFDAGATESGRPYFVMELVRGVPITEFCDKNHLPPAGRLELFQAVCSAVQHAHQKGIIHRDLKPSNILVTLHDGRPVPKVIDFGVAKATNQQLTERTLFTAFGQMVGTPAYMSPEQAEMSGLDIDTRSDIYALGVLLYELLTGTTPLEGTRLRQAGYAEMQRLIREEEPPRPSVRLSSLGGKATVMAGNRGTDVKRLGQLLRGDLDWIVMKALEKDRNRRYETPSAFAQDVERFLKNEAILARPPSALYKLRKFVRRNRKAVLMAAVVLFLLADSIAAICIGLVAATKSEADARRDAARARDAEQQAAQGLIDVQRERDAANAARSDAEAKTQLLKVAVAQEDSRRLAAHAMAALPTDPGQALLLAIAGAEKSPARSAPHNNALLAALQECREERTLFPPPLPTQAGRTGRPRFIALQITPDGRRAVAVGVRADDPGLLYRAEQDNDSAYVYDLQSGQVTATMRLPGQRLTLMAISPDGRLLAAVPNRTVVTSYNDGQVVAYTERAVRLWDMQTGKELCVLKGHTDRIVSLSFDAKGERLLTASWDKTARIWDVKSGKTLHVLADSDGSLELAEFSPDGRRALTIGKPGILEGTDIVRCGGRTSRSGIRFEPAKVVIDPPVRADGTIRWCQFIGGESGSSGGGINPAPRLWDAASGKRLAVLTTAKPHSGAWEHDAGGFSPDSMRVVTMGGDKISLWKAEDGEHAVDKDLAGASPDQVLTDGDRHLRVVRSSGPKMGIGAVDRGPGLLIWQSEANQQRWQRALVAEHRRQEGWNSEDRQPVLLDSSLEGTALIAWAAGDVVSIRSLLGGNEVAVLRGHDDTVTAAAFLPGAKRILTASLDGTLRLWSLEPTHNPVIELKQTEGSRLGYAVYLPRGRHVLTGPARDQYARFAGKSLALWNAESRALVRELAEEAALATTPLHKQLLGDLCDVDVSPDGERLVTVHRDSNPCTDLKQEPQPSPLYTPVRVWDLKTGKQLFALKGFRSGVATARFSPDGQWILTLSDGTRQWAIVRNKNQVVGSGSGGQGWARVDIWDAHDGKLIRSLVPETSGGGSFALWSPVGKRVLTNALSPWGSIAADVYDAETGRRVCRLKGESTGIDHAAFSPDGKLVLGYRALIIVNQELVEVWDATTGDKRFTLGGQKGSVTSADFSADSHSIVTTSTDGTARLSDAATGEARRVLRGHRHVVHMGRISPDSQWIATASADGTARIWIAATGQEWLTLPVAHGFEFVSVEFSSDSHRLLTVSTDGTARIWPIDPLPLAVARKPRELTADERARYQVESRDSRSAKPQAAPWLPAQRQRGAHAQDEGD